RMKYLHKYKEYTTERIITAFKGSCYCYDSVPFTYMFFTRSPMTLETLFETVSAGGDADSNGSMVGNLLGALHGSSIFPQHLIDGLKDREKLE
ncbi:ADP-ribosylglycohydrolase family protein, partial [Streptomyces scabiei]